MTYAKQFRFIPIGESFDWIDDIHPQRNSFFLRCTKVSERCYVDSNGTKHRVGTIKAMAYHVGGRE